MNGVNNSLMNIVYDTQANFFEYQWLSTENEQNEFCPSHDWWCERQLSQ